MSAPPTPRTAPIPAPAPSIARNTPAALPRRRGVGLLLVVLGVGLVALALIAAGRGQLAIAPAEVLGSVLDRIGLGGIGGLPATPEHPSGEVALWSIRFPRVAMAALVGASLAAAGALMQGVFGNPLAEPSVVGVSAGAAVAAAAAIVTGVEAFGPWTVAVAAFLGGLVTTLLVYALSRYEGRTEVVTLLLTGIAVNAVCSGLLALLMFLGDTQSREQIVFWQLGSLNGTRWVYVAAVAPAAIVGLLGAVALARRLDLLALGDRSARHLGVNTERTRILIIVLVALLTAAAVSFAGIIGFVGLIVPHLVRMLVGPSHRVLVIASALGGAVLLVLADLVARTAVAYADLPIGMLTALVGGPVFFWLLRRARAQAGAWA